MQKIIIGTKFVMGSTTRKVVKIKNSSGVNSYVTKNVVDDGVEVSSTYSVNTISKYLTK